MEHKTAACPNCRGEIKCLYTPRTMVTHYSRAASNKKAMTFFRDEKYVPLEDCTTCGTSQAELKKQFSGQQKSMTAGQAAKRALAAGLPLKF